ncbi:MAG: protein BatD [Planctomycetaceae bacterium]|nr:protein BatD [Planctomycetaceae bacterium]
MGTRRIAAIVVLLAAAHASGQDVRVQVAVQRPPHYVGRPAIIQFTVEGFDQEPTPTVEMQPLPEGVRAHTSAVAPRVVSGYSNINGRISQYTKVTYQINCMVTADKAGEYTIGPFVLKQGTKEANADAVPMTFEAVPEDPDMRIRLVLPEGNVYPDQRVPVKIEWWYAGDTEAIQDLSIYSPLFDQFRFGPDAEPRRGESRLPIDTKDGRIVLAAGGRRVEDGGKEFVAVTATRTLIPDRVGAFPLAPITATLERATEWRQQRSPFDDFGFGSSLLEEMMGDRRRAANTAISRAAGEPQTLVVKPFPAAGRPESFAGAVGEGFSIDVAAGRTVVRVGDPIGLDITLRGKGNLENASLPPLTADGGLNPDLFRLPEGDIPGTMDDGAKRFHVSVRVSSESVAEIPALAYSWFDPQTETYQTARSKPIALRVMPAQVVSADDVVSSVPKPETPQGEENQGDRPQQAASASPSEPVFSLSGADLAIEPAAGVVLRDSGDWTSGVPLQLAFYGAGFLLIAVAVLDRRRSEVDPAVVARRKNVRSQLDRISHASRLRSKEAATEIAAALRALVAEMPDVARDEAQAVIASCESIVFAPAGSQDSKLAGALLEEAKTVAARFKHRE